MFAEHNARLQVAFDNTSLSVFKDCARKYKYSILEGWRAKGVSPPLAWGLAFHDGLEVYEKAIAAGVARTLALRAMIRAAFASSEKGAFGGYAVDTARTRETLLRSLVWYTENYSNDPIKTYTFSNGRVGLELSFRFELAFSPKGSNTPYIYCGHMDRLGEYNSQLWAVERKTTKSSLNEQFFNRYFFSSQIGGYVYAGKVVFERPVAGAIIDATQTLVNSSKYHRAVIHRINDHLEEWMENTHYWIRQIEYSASHDSWPQNTESCSKYAGCQFQKVCSKNKALRAMILESDFEKRPWNPLASRGED